MNESPSARQRALDLLASLEEPEGLLGDAIADAERETAERFGFPNDAPVELQIRLQGERARNGFYDPDVEAELSGPLGKELAAALGKARQATRLGLVDISEGSVVLHYRVHELLTEHDGDENAPPIDIPEAEASRADTAVRTVLRLHELFEGQASAAEVSSFAKDHNGLLKAARGVVEALTKFELDMSATWRSPGGERVRSVLGERGRLHAHGLFQRFDAEDQVQVIGRVAALDIDGAVTIATESNHRIVVTLEPDQVGEFTLGESAAIWARVVTPKDRVGLSGRAKYRFSSHIEAAEPLWIDPSG